jgi:multiple sugar transport system substrate-binding protein
MAMSRRLMVGAPLGLAAASVLARPYIANAQAKTAVVWINQGFVHQEDEAFRQTAADYEKAGYKPSDAPKTWDAFNDFFKGVQTSLRGKGMRRVYALGLSMTTVGPNDGNGLFQYFVVANGGKDIVTPDGKLHTDDPQVREAFVKSVDYLTTAYKGGFVPPEVLTWNDSDNNNGFHSKLFVMDLDGTISTELAMIDNEDAYYRDSVTMGLPNGNDGKPMPALVGAGGGFIPRGAKNIEFAKDFMKYFMQPKVMGANLKVGLGRWVPAIPSIVRDDPWWLDSSSDPHRAPYVREAVLGPTLPAFEGYNPAWGKVSAEQLWGVVYTDVMKNGMTPAAAVAKGFHRAEEIFAQYPMT